MSIQTIDDWNVRLGYCGCCEMPKCCPPVLECQSGYVRATRVGYRDEGTSDSDSDPSNDVLYLRQSERTTEDSIEYEAEYPHSPPSPGATYVNQEIVSSGYQEFGQEWSALMDISIAGAYFAGTCYQDDAEETTYCEYGGTRTESNYSIHWNGSEWQRYKSTENAWTYSSAEGETTEAFTAWRDLYPTDGDFDDAVAAYDQYLIDQAEYEEAWAAWDAGGQIGPEPEPPDPVDEPTARPDEFYGPCDWKEVEVFKRWDPIFSGSNLTGTTLEEETTTTFYGTTGSPLAGPVTVEPDSYSEPKTVADFHAAAEAWVGDNIDRILNDTSGSDSAPCDPGTLCAASRELTNSTYAEDFFRYRWKLNKCCGSYSKLQWLEVFRTAEFLAWMDEAALTDSDNPPMPSGQTLTPRSWTWTGSGPAPECDDSDSGSDSDSVFIDFFDDVSRWSPWSLTIRVPTGEEGEVTLARLYMTCYRSPYGTKPDYIPILENYDSGDLDQDSVPDSAEP